MDERQLQQLIINISALHQELQKQSAEALSLQAQGIRRLEEGLSEVNRLVADEVSNQMAAVSGDLRRNIKKGSQEGLDDLRAEIDDVKKHMEDFAGFSAVAQNRLDAASRSVLLKIGYLAVAALVCVIGVSLWQGWYYGQVVREKKPAWKIWNYSVRRILSNAENGYAPKRRKIHLPNTVSRDMF